MNVNGYKCTNIFKHIYIFTYKETNKKYIYIYIYMYVYIHIIYIYIYLYIHVYNYHTSTLGASVTSSSIFLFIGRLATTTLSTLEDNTEAAITWAGVGLVDREPPVPTW
jgi:hypothetical protein